MLEDDQDFLNADTQQGVFRSQHAKRTYELRSKELKAVCKKNQELTTKLYQLITQLKSV
jgi:hypothetical protein